MIHHGIYNDCLYTENLISFPCKDHQNLLIFTMPVIKINYLIQHKVHDYIQISFGSTQYSHINK